MLRQPPFKYGATPAVPGIHNDNAAAPYVNGDPATGTEGSYIPCEAIDHPQTELIELITSSGITPSVSVLDQVAEAAARYASGGRWGQDNGIANSYVIVAQLAFGTPRAYFAGQKINFIAANSNGGESLINVFGGGQVPLRDHVGDPLEGGEIIGGREAEAVYMAAGYWQLAPWANALLFGAGGGGGSSELRIVKTRTGGSSPSGIGDTLTFSVTATNISGGSISGVHVTDTASPITVTSDPSGLMGAGATLASGASATVVYTYVVTSGDAAVGSVVNTATVTGTGATPASSTVVTAVNVNPVIVGVSAKAYSSYAGLPQPYDNPSSTALTKLTDGTTAVLAADCVAIFEPLGESRVQQLAFELSIASSLTSIRVHGSSDKGFGDPSWAGSGAYWLAANSPAGPWTPVSSPQALPATAGAYATWSITTGAAFRYWCLFLDGYNSSVAQGNGYYAEIVLNP